MIEDGRRVPIRIPIDEFKGGIPQPYQFFQNWIVSVYFDAYIWWRGLRHEGNESHDIRALNVHLHVIRGSVLGDQVRSGNARNLEFFPFPRSAAFSRSKDDQPSSVVFR
jgi:hypothetical protein